MHGITAAGSTCLVGITLVMMAGVFALLDTLYSKKQVLLNPQKDSLLSKLSFCLGTSF
jgi:hypothetical protein